MRYGAEIGERDPALFDRRAAASVFLGLAAILLGLLPIPFVAFRLLPAYHMHSRFLVFYTPLVCLLVLGYLFYIRDAVGRVVFADVMSPPVPPDPELYEVESETSPRIGGRIRSAVFALLPLLLLAASAYCLTHYLSRFSESLAVAGQVVLQRFVSAPVGDSPAAPGDAKGDSGISDAVASPSAPIDSTTTTAAGALPPDSTGPEAGLAALRSIPGLADDLDPLRTYTLERASIDDIPYFMELTTLYIGAIVSALAGVFLILLKEYARRAIGLTDREVIWRTRTQDSVATELENVVSPEQPLP